MSGAATMIDSQHGKPGYARMGVKNCLAVIARVLDESVMMNES